jgi:predicted Zn-dependent peptidase
MSVEVTKLPSGLTVITDTMPHLQTAALGIWAGVGGRDEKPNEHGISHLLEHMAFKGTTRRTSREIVEEIEAVGGDLNAGTSTETTAYYARVMKADVPLALDVLSDILTNPSFVPDELEREKSVIVQEIGAAQDTPDDVVFEHLNELCYPDQPMGRCTIAVPIWWSRQLAPSTTSGWSKTWRSVLQILTARRRQSPSPRCSAREARAWCTASLSRRI